VDHLRTDLSGGEREAADQPGHQYATAGQIKPPQALHRVRSGHEKTPVVWLSLIAQRMARRRFSSILLKKS
jgi:hypothetical protein